MILHTFGPSLPKAFYSTEPPPPTPTPTPTPCAQLPTLQRRSMGKAGDHCISWAYPPNLGTNWAKKAEKKINVLHFHSAPPPLLLMYKCLFDLLSHLEASVNVLASSAFLIPEAWFSVSTLAQTTATYVKMIPGKDGRS